MLWSDSKACSEADGPSFRRLGSASEAADMSLGDELAPDRLIDLPTRGGVDREGHPGESHKIRIRDDAEVDVGDFTLGARPDESTLTALDALAAATIFSSAATLVTSSTKSMLEPCSLRPKVCR